VVPTLFAGTLTGLGKARAASPAHAAGLDCALAGIDTLTLRRWLPPPMSFHVKPSRRYLLISPCRDEAQYLRRTLDSVAAQSVQPAAWVVVDDGSTDETPDILEEYARRLPYLRVVRRTDRGRRQVGPGVIEAFYAGLKTVRPEDFDYLCKLDTDLDLPVRYFELLMQRMESDPRVGTTSGKPWFFHPQTGALAPEICGDEMSVGMTKFYRVACFKEIGGFVREVMWDGIDCHRARMLGWIAESIDHEPLRFVHLRPQGASQKGIWTGRLRAGFGQYFMGTSPLYYLVVALYRLPAHPVLIGSVAMLMGYLRSWLKSLPRYDDLEFRRFLQSYQHACLRMGKRAATARVNTERAHLWHASRLHRETEARDDDVPDRARPRQVLHRLEGG
jgi:poly-beta-1,6-N-acetyl-D-glucosamine synthase